jgi:hypothetical protein
MTAFAHGVSGLFSVRIKDSFGGNFAPAPIMPRSPSQKYAIPILPGLHNSAETYPEP